METEGLRAITHSVIVTVELDVAIAGKDELERLLGVVVLDGSSHKALRKHGM